MDIAYVDNHYGSADGIIDPKEYASSYTDPTTGVTVYLEHNSTLVYVGLSSTTRGWMAIGWQNQTNGFTEAGLNGSDIIFGYSPGTPSSAYPRVTGADVVSVNYTLSLRNGTVIESGEVPDDLSETPIEQESLLERYKEEIIGMRIGEVRHFVIPAADAYNVESHPFYGFDLEYVITLTRINDIFTNPAETSRIVYSDEHGASTFQHIPDSDQSSIYQANASDDGSLTQIEYVIRMNSTDPDDIPLLNGSDTTYPMILMFGAGEDTSDLPIQHTDWTSPIMATLVPNAAPALVIESPEQDAELGFVTALELNASDNTYVRRAYYKVDNENWTEIFHDFEVSLWTTRIDLSEYDNGPHTIWFNATDPSDMAGIAFVNVTLDWPYQPLLGMQIEVDRSIFTRLYHTTEVEDSYIIHNNGSAPISAIEIFLPEKWSNNFLSISATDSSDNDIRIERLEDTHGLLHWRVFFQDPISYQETYEFSTSTWLHSISTLVDFDGQLYEIGFLKYPVLPYVIRAMDFHIEFRSGDTLEGSLPETETTNLAPMRIEQFTFTIQSFTPLVVAERVTKITIDPWGWMTYEETITLENIGTASDFSTIITLPAYTTSITLFDEVGVLAQSVPPDTREFNQTARVPVHLDRDRFGQDAFSPGYKYTFNVYYVAQVSSYQTLVPAGNQLSFPMSTLGDVLVTKHTVDIVLPSSVAVSSASGDYRLLYGVFDATLRYEVHNTTEKNPATIVLSYQTSLGAAARPLVFTSIFGLVLVVYVVWRKVELPEEAAGLTDGGEQTRDSRQTGAPPELLREFAGLYSRKTALGMDLEKLEASRRRGKMKKREFMIRERDLKKQIGDVDSKLPDMKDELMSHGSRYRDMVAQLELQEEKIEGAKAGLRQLLLRKKKQRISRVAFERTREDYLKTIKRATTETDKILLSIQEEAGDL
jgi:hypothetical protein